MFIVSVIFDVHPEHVEAFMARMRIQAEQSVSREPDCHGFDVCTDPEDPTRVFLYETYTDRAAFDTHLESDHFKSYAADTADWVRGKTLLTWTRVVPG